MDVMGHHKAAGRAGYRMTGSIQLAHSNDERIEYVFDKSYRAQAMLHIHERLVKWLQWSSGVVAARRLNTTQPTSKVANSSRDTVHTQENRSHQARQTTARKEWQCRLPKKSQKEQSEHNALEKTESCSSFTFVVCVCWGSN